MYSGVSEDIYHLDEKLTTSTYMYILTKSEEWKKNYTYNRDLLTQIIKEKLATTEDDVLLKILANIKIAEIQLLRMENDALR